MRITFFGTYDPDLSPRVTVWKEGFAAHGDEIHECNVPLPLDNAAKVRILHHPWLTPVLVLKLLKAWTKLWLMAREAPRPDAVAVGYMGHFDVHLARRIWRETPIVLDHLVSAADTARDRGIDSRLVLKLLDWIDNRALWVADLCCVDTEEQLELIPPQILPKALVAWVGSPGSAFREPSSEHEERLRVVFFGSYTPLQGAPLIGEAIRILGDESEIEFTMVGRGQDVAETRRAADGCESVTWIDWVDPKDLPALLNSCHICLGIFGKGPKAQRVVPNKVFQGAAAGCAIVTSDTRPQRRALADAGIFVPAGSADHLAQALRKLADDPILVEHLRWAAFRRASTEFAPYRCVHDLRSVLGRLARPGIT